MTEDLQCQLLTSTFTRTRHIHTYVWTHIPSSKLSRGSLEGGPNFPTSSVLVINDIWYEQKVLNIFWLKYLIPWSNNRFKKSHLANRIRILLKNFERELKKWVSRKKHLVHNQRAWVQIPNSHAKIWAQHAWLHHCGGRYKGWLRPNGNQPSSGSIQIPCLGWMWRTLIEQNCHHTLLWPLHIWV